MGDVIRDAIDQSFSSLDRGREAAGRLILDAPQARRIRSGMTGVNAVIPFTAIPSLPFGGVGDSGFGRIHGADGLKEFTYAKAIARQRMKPLMALTTFARSEKTDTKFLQLITALHGRASQLPKRKRSRT